jgi:RNA polymerase sigma-70 factor, ECF subfamily
MQTCVSQAIAVLPANFPRPNSLPAVEIKLRELSPLELVRCCLSSREESAWQEFVRRFQPLIASTIIKTLRHGKCFNFVLIDDLVQETYVKLFAHDFKALREFDFRHAKALFGFFRVVASNVVQDHFRNRCSQKRGSGKVDEDLEMIKIKPPSNHGFAEKAERGILVAQLKKCLKMHAAESDFSRNYAIFRLYFEHGLTAKAIANLPNIGLSVKGVESALGRLTRMIKETINKPTA